MSGLLADLLVVLHLLFVAFVGLGGLLVLRWPWVAWLHLPAAAWGVGIELTGRICPLTPLAEELGAEDGAVADMFLPTGPAAASRSSRRLRYSSVRSSTCAR